MLIEYLDRAPHRNQGTAMSPDAKGSAYLAAQEIGDA